MSTLQKTLLFILLPFLSPLILPLSFYTSGAGGPILFLGVLLGVSSLILGPFLWRGRSTALTLAIFLQGLNVVIRLMMFFPNLSEQGIFDIPWFITSMLSMGLSLYLVLRLDQTDVRVTMVT